MCKERYLRRRPEADESRELWRDFTETRPIDDPDPREVTEPEQAEARDRAPPARAARAKPSQIGQRPT